jgi:hypothetical protein
MTPPFPVPRDNGRPDNKAQSRLTLKVVTGWCNSFPAQVRSPPRLTRGSLPDPSEAARVVPGPLCPSFAPRPRPRSLHIRFTSPDTCLSPKKNNKKIRASCFNRPWSGPVKETSGSPFQKCLGLVTTALPHPVSVLILLRLRLPTVF